MPCLNESSYSADSKSFESCQKVESKETEEKTNRLLLPLLAIDGGGTKTIAVITDKDGKILGKGKAGASNYQVVGKENAVATLKNVIKKAISHLKEVSGLYSATEELEFKRAVFALAGVDTEEDKVKVKEIIDRVLAQMGLPIHDVIVENDALSVLLGETNRSPGALLISGTGSIAFAYDGKNQCVRVGGRGYVFGDEGSGYWIGKKAISSVVRMFDGREPKSILADLVLEHFHFENGEQLYNWINSPNCSVHTISSLSAIVRQAYLLGDPVSLDILNRAVKELYILVMTAIKKTNILNTRFKIVLLGGILQNNEYIKNKLIEKIKEEAVDVEILSTNQKPINLIIRRGLFG